MGQGNFGKDVLNRLRPNMTGGQYRYNPRNDTWLCNRLGFDPSA